MERFLVTLLLLSLSSSTLFVSGTNHSLSNDHDLNEESITVHLKAYKEEVLGCTIQVENESGDFVSFPLYDKNEPIAGYDMFNFIGKEDNSCSFITYPKHKLFKKFINEYVAFRGKWIIVEKYSCDKSFWNIVTLVYNLKREGCYREYNIFFNPRIDVERMSMTWTATKIIRKAPYDNRTLTVFVQSEAQQISMCTLTIGPQSFFNLFDDDDIIIYDKSTSYSSSAESGIEYIGFNDNSCSVRIHLDVLNTTNKENDILNQDWMIFAIPDGFEQANSKYSFYMNSKKWWIDNHYSKVFLRYNFLTSTDVHYY
ncbi:hypothetical protein HCN44_009590 [Aphidius gifuensis]|uniref:Odorant-binding protein n=1 Tax=Aphidius gifuensis TaxID=684658 RepID=A0A835CW68_APHGI|nr:uncharacterized protein LOC122860368 [Aphidius gifuensis]KAF7998192.1 hypothetical protein HCN44_009590 [Aphidius gifuensis]